MLLVPCRGAFARGRGGRLRSCQAIGLGHLLELPGDVFRRVRLLDLLILQATILLLAGASAVGSDSVGAALRLLVWLGLHFFFRIEPITMPE